MRPYRNRTNRAARGFTLLETLVALTILATLIATLIPLSRNTLFRIAKIRDEAQRLSLMQERIATWPEQVASGTRTENGITFVTQKRALPPFDYGKDAAPQFQPYLVTLETRSASGAWTKAEYIRLERTAP